MKQPLWKRALSFFYEFHIENTSSEHNPHLYVSFRNGRYQLCTANAIYSYEDLYDNFTTAFDRLDLSQLPGKRVLILGFGLASIPLILERRGHLDFKITGVEIDEEVLSLARKYALPAIHSPTELICSDAFAYVEQCQQKYDLITMDVFLDDVVPEVFEQKHFLQQIQGLIAPGGLLMYNRLAYSQKDIDLSHAFYHDQFQSVFPESTYLEVKGNWMLLNRPHLLK